MSQTLDTQGVVRRPHLLRDVRHKARSCIHCGAVCSLSGTTLGDYDPRASNAPHARRHDVGPRRTRLLRNALADDFPHSPLSITRRFTTPPQATKGAGLRLDDAQVRTSSSDPGSVGFGGATSRLAPSARARWRCVRSPLKQGICFNVTDNVAGGSWCRTVRHHERRGAIRATGGPFVSGLPKLLRTGEFQWSSHGSIP